MSAELLGDPAVGSSQSSSPDASYSQAKEERILKTQYLGIPGSSQRRSSLESSFSELSELSFLSNEIRNERPRLPSSHISDSQPRPLTRKFKDHMRSFWIRNKGMILVLGSMFFGSGMNVGTRLLETPGPHGAPMHPYQILFVRQSITASCCTIYGLWTKKIPDFPFGPRKVRCLLVSRGLCGFFGVFGFYFSLMYLPLAEATVLTFLAPILTCYVCSFTISGETFSRQQQLAGFLSLGGVVFIALSATVSSSPPPPPDAQGHAPPSGGTETSVPPRVSAHQHLAAVGISMIGVLGATGAMTSIRAIGTQAHPFLSINYFSVWCTIVSLICLIIFPSVSFRLPGNLLEWSLLAMLGSCGFIMQFLLTAGLAYGGPTGEQQSGNAKNGEDLETNSERISTLKTLSKPPANQKKSSGTRATSMVYTQMLFSLVGDKLVFGVTPTLMSWIGSGLILAGAIWVAAAKDADKPDSPNRPRREWTKDDLAAGRGGDGSSADALVGEGSAQDQRGDGRLRAREEGEADDEQILIASHTVTDAIGSSETIELQDLDR